MNENSKEALIKKSPADINFGLNELGMLSTVTHSRLEYIQESENFITKLNDLNMESPAGSPNVKNSEKLSLINFNSDSNDTIYSNVSENQCSGGTCSQEKCKNSVRIVKNKQNLSPVVQIERLEDKASMIDCLSQCNCDSIKKIYNLDKLCSQHKDVHDKSSQCNFKLVMNSSFITNFQFSYVDQGTDLRKLCGAVRLTPRMRKRSKSHPYDKISNKGLKNKQDNSKEKSDFNFLQELEITAHRLRTASLSSGKKHPYRPKIKKIDESSYSPTSILKRSRSMENLTAGHDDSSPYIVDVSKDIELVSTAIQHMKMADST